MVNQDNFTGAIVIIVILSAVFTLVLSLFLLKLYRKSVLRNMEKQSGTSGTQTNDLSHTNPEPAPDPIVLHHRTTENDGLSCKIVMNRLNRNCLYNLAAGLVYAGIMSLAWAYAADKSFGMIRLLVLLVCFSWPVIVTFRLIHPYIAGRSFIVYVITYILAGTVAVVTKPEFSFSQLLILWLIQNGPVTCFLFLISNRNIRSVGPLVFVFMITAFTGAYLLIDLLSKSEALMMLSANIGSILGVKGRSIILFFVITGLVLFAPVGWRILRWIGKRYQHKKMSDQSLTLDSVWLIFGFFHSFTFIHDNFWLAFTGLGAFIFYKLTLRMFRFFNGVRSDFSGHRILLLLRVFALGKKSESLFDSITSVWLHGGSICMLSGPDLATSTLEPHEFYDFIGGRLTRQFIHDTNELHIRTSNMDLLPDPDGRYRVNEFFCMADTWKPTMQNLAGRCSAVLMDLRSYSGKNRASTFELTHLLNSFPLRQIVLLTDQTTDISFLKTTVSTILDDPGNVSLNEGLSVNDLHIVEFRQNSRDEMQKLHELLFRI